MENTFVYHGSPREFNSEYAVPKRNIRTKWDNVTKSNKTIFDQESFHATPYKWIALAYTYRSEPFEIDGKKAHYNMGVSLYDDTTEISVYGFNSLEDSLRVLYGNGGYLYIFYADNFIHKDGLGNREVISEKSVKPVAVEHISDPVSEIQKLGVTFKFIDLALPENEDCRNYY